MDISRCRRFNLGDAMIAVATVAVAMTLMPDDPGGMIRRAWTGYQLRTVTTPIEVAKLLIVPWSCWTVAYLAFRSRRPRPPWREIREQPGFVAAALALVTGGLQIAYITSSPAAPLISRDLLEVLPGVSPTVLGGWSALWLAGRFRAEPGWIDRLGRTLGWGWMVLYLVQQINLRFFPILYR